MTPEGEPLRENWNSIHANPDSQVTGCTITARIVDTTIGVSK
jgi:hypothetical protein